MGVLNDIHQLLDVSSLLSTLGPWALIGIGVMVFIESGVLFPFLPGDSLIVTAMMLRVPLSLEPWQIILVACIAAIAGDQVGYWLGHRFGRGLFKDDARVLKTERLEAAEGFFAKRGPLALVLGRFVPIVRTYVPLAAGTAKLHYRKFVLWNVLGAMSWVLSMSLVGLLLGNIPGITKSIDLIAVVIVLISVLPIVVKALMDRHKSQREES